MKYMYVALFGGLPVAVSETTSGIEDILAEWTKGGLVKYEAFNPKYPDDFQGWYTYVDNHGDELQFKLYTVDYN